MTVLAATTTKEVSGLRLTFIRGVESSWKAAGAGGSSAGGYSTRVPSKGEVDILFMPKLRQLGFKFVTPPEFVFDDNPVWLARSTSDPERPYELYIGSGPFAGERGTDFDRAPSFEELTNYAPKGIFKWSATVIPTDYNMTVERQRAVLQVMREASQALQFIAGLDSAIKTPKGVPYLLDPVSVPEEGNGVLWAILGALSALGLGVLYAKRDKSLEGWEEDQIERLRKKVRSLEGKWRQATDKYQRMEVEKDIARAQVEIRNLYPRDAERLFED